MTKPTIDNWIINKIGVIGPGIVGMPMAGMLAHAKIMIGTNQPAKVVVVQRNSESSGWKVNSINLGLSVIGGIEPELDEIIRDSVSSGILSATSDFHELADADVVLVAVQTDKNGFEPDYGPLFGALEKLGEVLEKKPVDKVPLIIFESTLAPTTMDTLIRTHFKKYGLYDGKDILLGNSPNRVMPGRLVERIRKSDKLAGGMDQGTPKLISRLYKNIIKEGEVFQTNSLTAEIVKTLENAYRDVRIAFSTEIARFCDGENISFHHIREEVNSMLGQKDMAGNDPNVVPSGGLLIPMLGVGGHCLPKDGILLMWRTFENGSNNENSIISQSRSINDESPVYTYRQAEKIFDKLRNGRIALMGVAYRFNSEDTRNSPTLSLANYLRSCGISYIMHDPFVKKNDQNILKFDQARFFTRDLQEALDQSDYVFMCTGHRLYIEEACKLHTYRRIKGIMDACNIYNSEVFKSSGIIYTGIGRGTLKPEPRFIDFVFESFKAMEKGFASELLWLIDFYNKNFVSDKFNMVDFKEVQKLAKTCSTGCEIGDPGKVLRIPQYHGFSSRLVQCAFNRSL